MGFLGLGGFLIGFMALPLLHTSKKEASGCGCGSKSGNCGKKDQYKSEMNQDVHAAPTGELNRVNPTIVESAEDIMGAENVAAGPPGVVYMQPWNDLTLKSQDLITTLFRLCLLMECQPTLLIMMAIMHQHTPQQDSLIMM